MWRGLRLAGRRLWRRPGFTALAVVILALGLGASVTMFSLVNALVLRALPYSEADRLVFLFAAADGKRAGTAHSLAAFREYQRQDQVFESVAAFRWREPVLEQPGQTPASTWGLDVSADFLKVLRVQPRLGRGFLPGEDQPGKPRVAIVSTRFWQDRLGGDPGVIGRPIRLDGETHTVVGVMASEFQNSPRLWVRADVWRPFALPPAGDDRGQPAARPLIGNVFGRLRPGITLVEADARLRALPGLVGPSGAKQGAQPRPLGEREWDNTGRAAWLTLALAVLVLFVACVNLIGLQLARLAGRGHDRAIRMALGASRGRLVREALAESLLISLAGGALGLLIADGFIQQLASRLTWGGATRVALGITLVSPFDPGLLVFTLVLAVATALVVGTVPAWLGSSVRVAQDLRHGGRGTTSRAHHRLRAAIVVTEMALALVLLAAGGLFVRGLQRLGYSDPGWRFDEVLYTRVDLPRPGYPDRQSKLAFNQRLQQRLRAMPAVASSAFTTEPPQMPPGDGFEFVVDGASALAPGMSRRSYFRGVSPEYFQTLGIPLLAGRTFHCSDVDQGLFAVVINDSMARALWPGKSPIGKRIASAAGGAQRGTIVGVVPDVRFSASLNRPTTPYQIYYSLVQGPPLMSSVVVVRARPGIAPGTLGVELARAIAEVDPAVPAVEVLTPRAMVERSYANFTAMGWIVFAFAGLGLVLSGLGVYGLFAGLVAERTREIGVRLALGAQAQQVLRLMLAAGLRLALVGAALGLIGALSIGPVLTAAVQALPTRDPVVLGGLVASLVAVALLACWLPARKAARVDPMVALRSE